MLKTTENQELFTNFDRKCNAFFLVLNKLTNICSGFCLNALMFLDFSNTFVMP